MDVVAGEHESGSALNAQMRVIWPMMPEASFTADDVVDLGQALQRGRLDVDAGAALHAIDDDRKSTASAIAL